MKKYLLVLFVLSLLVFSGSLVSAQTDSASSGYSYQASVSVKPVGFWDKVNLFFTFNREKKAELLQEFSDRNFEIAKEKISQQKPEEAKVLLDEADKDINKATKAVSKFKDEKKQQEVLSNISTVTANRAETLSRVLEQVQNPVAKQAITNAIEKQSEIKSDVDRRINVLLNRIAELEAKIKQIEQKKTGDQPIPVAPVPTPAVQEEETLPTSVVPAPISVPTTVSTPPKTTSTTSNVTTTSGGSYASYMNDPSNSDWNNKYFQKEDIVRSLASDYSRFKYPYSFVIPEEKRLQMLADEQANKFPKEFIINTEIAKYAQSALALYGISISNKQAQEVANGLMMSTRTGCFGC